MESALDDKEEDYKLQFSKRFLKEIMIKYRCDVQNVKKFSSTWIER
jgi:hypothetical protein